MPGLTGPRPKDTPQQRERDQKRRVDANTIEVAEHEGLIGPALGAHPTPGESWLPATTVWYDGWRASAQATIFIDTDWQRLQMLALTVDHYYSGEVKLLGEIRLNETKLGATITDRIQMRMQVVRPEPPQVIQLVRPGLAERLAARDDD